jgi:WD40 repeat protein
MDEPAEDRGYRSPYQGLDYYTEDDAEWFFGRRSERNRIISNLRTSRLTVLYAESGVGKSSLLRAGAVARLRELARDDIERRGSARFVPVVFRDWQDEPSDYLIAEIERQVAPFVASVTAPTRPSRPSQVWVETPEGPPGNGEAASTVPQNDLARAIARAVDATEATVLIILDQFEEHFRYRLQQPTPERVADEIAACVNAPALPVHFLIALREDAYGGLGDLFRGRVGNVYRNYIHLEYLTRAAAREAIEEPINRYNEEHPNEPPVTPGEGLTDAVLDEVRRGNLALGPGPDDLAPTVTPAASSDDEIEAPFLQLVMRRLWECEQRQWKPNQGARTLRKETLDETLGGAERIVRDHLTDALGDLTGEELDTAKLLFRELVTPSGAKIAHTADDLVNLTERPEDSVASVLETLDRERIVRAVDPAPGATGTRYEIFHDKLAAAVLDWLGLQKTEQLKHEKEQAEDEKQRAEDETRVQKEQADRLRVLNLRFRAATIFLVLALLVAGGLVVYALNQKSNAESATRSAHRASVTATENETKAAYAGLTSSAESQLASRPDVALLLFLAAYGDVPSGSKQLAERRLIATLQDVQMSGAAGILHGQSDAVDGLAFSRKAHMLASASGDGTIRLWHVDQRSRYPLDKPLKAGGPVLSVAFSPNGGSLAAGSLNKVVVWDVVKRKQVPVAHPPGAVTSVAYSPNGRWLAAASLGGSVVLLDTQSGKTTTLESSPAEPVRSVAFSRNSDLLAAGKLGGNVVLWNVAGGPPRTLTNGGHDVYAVAFSPTADTLAAAGQGSQIKLWNLADHDHVTMSPPGDQQFIYSLAFAPDGRTLAAAGAGQVLLVDPTTGKQVAAALAGQTGAVYAVAFSPDGHTLVSAGADRTIRVWDYPAVREYGIPMTPSHASQVPSVAVAGDGRIASGSADGQIFVVGGPSHTAVRISALPKLQRIALADRGRVVASASGKDGVISLWNADNGQPMGQLRPPGAPVPIRFLAADLNGPTLVSGDAMGNVRVWDVLHTVQVGPALTAGLGQVYAVAFNPRTRAIAAAGTGRTIQIWKHGSNGWVKARGIGQDAAVFALAFSPDGSKLAAGGGDDTIRIWNLTARSTLLPTTLIGHSGFVRGLAFSPDGATLASAGADRTVRLWDVGSGTELGEPLTGHTDAVESVAFTPDGKFLVSGSDDQTVREWQAVVLPGAVHDVSDQVCAFLGAGLNQAEWTRYAGSIRFQRTCSRMTPG